MSAPDDRDSIAERDGDPDEDTQTRVAVESSGSGGRRGDDNPAPTTSTTLSVAGPPLTGRMFASLHNPQFRLFMAAMMGQMGAMNMQMVARSLVHV